MGFSHVRPKLIKIVPNPFISNTAAIFDAYERSHVLKITSKQKITATVATFTREIRYTCKGPLKNGYSHGTVREQPRHRGKQGWAHVGFWAKPWQSLSFDSTNMQNVVHSQCKNFTRRGQDVMKPPVIELERIWGKCWISITSELPGTLCKTTGWFQCATVLRVLQAEAQAETSMCQCPKEPRILGNMFQQEHWLLHAAHHVLLRFIDLQVWRVYTFRLIFNLDDQKQYLLALSDHKKPDQDTTMEGDQSYFLFLLYLITKGTASNQMQRFAVQQLITPGHLLEETE